MFDMTGVLRVVPASLPAMLSRFRIPESTGIRESFGQNRQVRPDKRGTHIERLELIALNLHLITLTASLCSVAARTGRVKRVRPTGWRRSVRLRSP